MSILKLRYAITGYLEISVEGRATEKFINLAIRQGIPLWNIRYGAERAVMNVEVDSFFDLRHLSRKTGCRLQITRKIGLPFLLSRLRRRRGLVAGILFFILALYTLSSFVLFISVEGNERLDTQYIRSLAAEAGVRPGMPKSRLDKDDVARRLVLTEPELAWVGIHVRGTRMVIEVVEKIRPPVDIDMPGHVVAVKDGLVYDVLVITGEPRVKPGDTVLRGQVLIEGVLRPQTPITVEEDAGPPAEVPVRARGEVWARVWYEGYGEAALVETERIRTGRHVSVWTLVVDGQPVLRVGRQKIPYAVYEQGSVKTRVLERILRFPVEIITESAYEVEEQRHEISLEQAQDLAAERARLLAEMQLPVGVVVDNITIKDVYAGDEGVVGIRYVLETRENIAKEKHHPGGD